MIPAFPNAMPVEGFMGGLLIGLAAAIMLLGLGRIAGVSGLAARATGIADTGAPRNVAIAFVVGLPLAAPRRCIPQQHTHALTHAQARV